MFRLCFTDCASGLLYLLLHKLPVSILFTESLKLSRIFGQIMYDTSIMVPCRHILPSLAKLEKKYKGTPFVVVGVHSPKFENEKSSTNVKQAVDRYDIRHPVVNDKGMTMWNSVGVSSWPTLALLGPKGNLLSIWAGEGYEQRIDDFVQASLQFYGDSLDATPLPAPGTVPREVKNSPLNYPGKLFYDAPQQRLFVSDSSNHRIVVLGKNGQFMSSIGSKSGTPGFEDGDFSSARFNNPQGVTLVDGNLLYVADTENHAIRRIDLKANTVTTVAGNGEQGFDYTGGKKGRSQFLSSPWDVVPFPEDPKRKLLVAMAGIHQIWDVDCESGTASCYSGTGREREYNTEDRINSAWAQPSGLSLSADGRSALYVADSESSSIRELLLKGPGPTRTVVGGSGTEDGSNLFAFGDRDGKGSAAKLQHPLGVAVVDEQNVIVADTYNHKIKLVNPLASTLKTIAGSGKPGLKDGKGTSSEFWEPGGLAIDHANDIVFVADTNNKALRTLNYKTGEVKTLDISTIPSVAVAGEGIATEQRPLVNRKRVRVLDSAPVGLSGEVVVQIALPAGCKFTPGVESKWQLVDPSGVLDASSSRTGLLKLDGNPTSIKIKAKQEGKVELETAVYYCQIEDGVCKVDGVVLQVPVQTGGGSSVPFRQDVVLKTKAKLAQAPK